MTGFALPPGPQLPRVRWYNDEQERAATVSTQAPRVPWDKFCQLYFHPKPGEHVTFVGSTGKGKSELMNNILPLYPYTAVFGTKKADTTLSRLARNQGYIVLDKWRSLPARDYPRRIVWPHQGSMKQMIATQREVFEHAIDTIYEEGGNPPDNPVGWAIGIDEVWWFTKMLGMEMYIRVLLQHARSAGISLIAGTQRAAHVPTELFSQPTHLFFFLNRDANNLERISDLSVGNKRMIRDLVFNLEEFQVLYINNVTGQMARTRTPAPKG